MEEGTGTTAANPTSGTMRTADEAGRTAVRLDLASGTVTLHGQEVELPLREFRLFSVLAQRVGQPVATEDLIKAVWPEDAEWTSKEDFYVLVSKLRRLIDGPTKLGDNIRNRRGFGYLLDLDPSEVEVVISSSDSKESGPTAQPAMASMSPESTQVDKDTPVRAQSGDRPRVGAAALVIAALLVGSWVAGYSISRLTTGPRAPQVSDFGSSEGLEKGPPSPSPEIARRAQEDPKRSVRKNQSKTKATERRSSDGESLAVSGQATAASQQTSESTSEDPASGGQPARRTEPLPPAPTNYLYHLFNEETGDHFVTTDPGVASQYEGQGYQGGPIGRVYSYAEKNTKPIATNSGTAYIFASSSAKTEPASSMKALYYATNGEGDFFYTTSAAQASQAGWSASVIGHVRSL